MAMYGYLLSKSFNTSFSGLAEVMPIQTATRTMNAYLATNTDKVTCTSMFTTAEVTETEAAAVCETNSLETVDQMMFFVNSTWYCDAQALTDCEYYLAV
jgi:hypothetical protein